MERNAQLQLITFDNDWQLDRRTISVGKVGLAKARAILAEKSTNGGQQEPLAA